MARKRMFDLEIINQDSFFDMPMETKALYFLLGMEADDEGFVSPKKVFRLYGGTEDSLKVLILKGFVIPFKSGVVVITDWKRNNYLDKNRIKETIYQDEKSQITYNENTEKYEMLNNGLKNVKQMLNQYSIEENSIEENNIKENIKEKKYFENDKINEIFLEFLKVRKKLKAVNSDRAINTLINKLNQYEDDVKIQMIDQSIVNSWKDVYPLKNRNEKRIAQVPEWMDKEVKEEKDLSEEDRRFIAEIQGNS